jgi:hypothetical protein
MKGLSIAEYRDLALWLRGHSYAEIAKLDKTSGQTASRRVARARHKMATLLGYAGDYEEVWAIDHAKELLAEANRMRLRQAWQDEAHKRSRAAMKKKVEARRERLEGI